ncbi:M20/M25/M40 family metallo-hydrolase [Arthrobacter sp. ZGTC412]|uniref:M20/M25/M40 family metallo-hydrolase n=1 Tax=Arthrobacter sp. ZGTC412 TaxID=2058900 RepID=UPI000CE4E95E|nr:M20/M25/M40 family metallo-hydrolase [Arthrobacter sp. ZGTC412]
MKALHATGKPTHKAGIAFLALTLLLSACTSPAQTVPRPEPLIVALPGQASEVREAFAKRDLMGHLEALQKVADQAGGNRAAGTSGYEASARYVEDQLRAAGYKPVRQVFRYWDEDLEENRETFNILADTAGSADHTIVVGAHLDSVPDGPGINDNASGVATLIETARWMAETGVEPKNRVRFAFWGAEEVDLTGSQHYVDELSASEISQTAVNINIDLAASPNGVRFVHDGDGSSFGDAGPAGSPGLESILLDYFAKNSLPAEATAFIGDSDYDAFFQAGIATGGLFAGDVGTKTSEQVEKYGGTANEDHDRCYHRRCDTLQNVNQQLLNDMAGAIGYATRAFAMAQM